MEMATHTPTFLSLIHISIFVPFTTQELFDNGKESLYYGLNALSNNLITVSYTHLDVYKRQVQT